MSEVNTRHLLIISSLIATFVGKFQKNRKGLKFFWRGRDSGLKREGETVLGHVVAANDVTRPRSVADWFRRNCKKKPKKF
jgi:hypothetical protein